MLKFHRFISNFKFSLLLTALSAILLAGCGSSEKKDEDKDSKEKPASQRVAILKERFDQLENALVEMDRDLNLQKQRVEHTREMAKAIKRSLIKGNLKGYSIDTVSTEVLLMQSQARQQKEKEKKSEKDDKEEKKKAENSTINFLLITVFLAFLAVIFYVALKDKKPDSSLETWPPAYPPPSSTDDPVEADTTSGGDGYQELNPHQDSDNQGDTQPDEDRQQ